MDLKFGVEDMSALTATIVCNMVAEIFESYDLDICPETFFSTFIYGLVDAWLEKQDRDKDEFKKFLKVVKTVGASVYEDEKEGKL